VKAQADTLAERLHVALTSGAGRLADPTNLPFDDAMKAALDDLLT